MQSHLPSKKADITRAAKAAYSIEKLTARSRMDACQQIDKETDTNA
jgi:hypothetical protein